MSKDYSTITKMKNFREFLKEVHEAYEEFSSRLKDASEHIQGVPNAFPLVGEATQEASRLLHAYCQISQDSIANLKHQIEEYQILMQTSKQKQQQIHTHYIALEQEACKKRQKTLKEAEVRGMKLHKRLVLYRDEIPRDLAREMEDNEGVIENAKNDFLVHQITNELVEQFYQEQVDEGQRFMQINREIQEKFMGNCTQLAAVLCDSIGKTHLAIEDIHRAIDREKLSPTQEHKGLVRARECSSIPQIKVPLVLNEKTVGNLLARLKEEQARLKKLHSALQTAKENAPNAGMKDMFTLFELDLQCFRASMSVEILSSVLIGGVPEQGPQTPTRRARSFQDQDGSEAQLFNQLSVASLRKNSAPLFSPIKLVSGTPVKGRGESLRENILFSPISFNSRGRAQEEDPFQ